MAKTRDIRIIREIKPKIKVIEEDGEQVVKQEKEEEPLEDLVTDAPSAREFPEFVMLGANGAQGVQETAPREEIKTPSATTEEENKNVVRYQVQPDVTEEEIARIYRTAEVSEVRPIMLTTTGEERSQRGVSANREVEALRTKGAERRYEISIEPEKPVKKRKYPWEA